MSNRKRGARVLEALAVISVTIVVAICCVLVAVFDVPANYRNITWIAGAGAVVLTLHMFLAKWNASPDFITKHGVAVWTGGVSRITPGLMERAIDRFLNVMEVEQKEASRKELEQMFARTGVEWERTRVSLWIGGRGLREQTGIQWGHRVLLQWRGSIARSALNHELLHEVNECIRLPKQPEDKQREFRIDDVGHKENGWWRLEKVLADTF